MAAYMVETADKAIDLEPALQKIVDKVLIRERRLFETRGASSGVYWVPLRATTILRKKGFTAKHRSATRRRATPAGAERPVPFPDRPLWRFGDLMRSLSERHAPYQTLRVDRDSFELGTTHPAAAYHTTGTSRMPARPPLIIPAKHANEYIQDLEDFIFGAG